MKDTTYYQIMNYLNLQKRPVSPHELRMITKKSRVSVQSALKKLQKNGWLIKIGTSPKVFYKMIDPNKIISSTQEVTHETTIEKVENRGLLEKFIYDSNSVLDID